MEPQTVAQKPTPQRSRSIQKIIRMAPAEEAIIKHRMEEAKLTNFNLYALLMLLTGEIKNVDLSHYHELAKEVSRIGANINQIAKFCNTSGNIYPQEIAELQERMVDIWQLLKSNLSAQR